MAGKVRHLLNRDGRYFARIVIPPALRPYLDDKTELRTALGPDRRSALAKLPGAVAGLQHQTGLAEQRRKQVTGSGPTVSRYPLSAAQIAAVDYLSQIEFDAEIRMSDSRYAAAEVDADEARLYRDGYSGKLTDDELDELVGHRIRRAQLRGNTSAEKGSLEWRSIAHALCVASYEAMERQHERNEGVVTGSPSHPLLTNALAEKQEPEHVVTFDQIIDAEATRRARGKDAKPFPKSTIKKYRDPAAEFAKFRGSDNAATVTADEGKAWMEAMQDEGVIGNRTIKYKFQNVRTIINWARKSDPKNFLPTGNPLSDLQLPDFKTVPSYLRAFTMDEARLVLAAARNETQLLFRWIPWLCAYSGMRVSEAGSLRKEDFFESHGRWFWRVTTVGGRSLKNESSERRIPVHGALESEGLVEFVKAAPTGRLFIGKTKADVQIQPRMSAWVRSLIPFDKRPELSPNHGWRHLFEDFCRRDNVPEDARRYITGRTDGGSQDMYGRSEVMLPGLAAAMDLIAPIDVT